LKRGLSPFFFWRLVMGRNLRGFIFGWFIRVQKFYRVLLLFYLSSSWTFTFILLSLLFLYLNLWGAYSLKYFLILRSSERLAWLFLWGGNFWSVILLMIYLVVIYYITWTLQRVETNLVLMRFPLTIPFIFKIGGALQLNNFYGLVSLVIVFISILTISQVLLFIRRVFNYKYLRWALILVFLMGVLI